MRLSSEHGAGDFHFEVRFQQEYPRRFSSIIGWFVFHVMVMKLDANMWYF